MEQFVFTPEGVSGCSVCAWLQPELPGYPARKSPVMVVVPGGGYCGVAPGEGEPVAKPFYAAGFSTFILTYSVGERAKNFEPLSQLAATVAYIRRNEERLRIDPQRVAVIGFSAGGHLAGSLAVLYDDPKFLKVHPQTENIRPDAVILSYAVITANEYTHRDTICNISGGAEPGSAEYAYWGLDTHVSANTPPIFLWHTAEDACVPVENSLFMAQALSGAKVPFEMHIFPKGWHGMSVCNSEVGCANPYNGRWVQWCIAWLEKTMNING